MRTAEASRSGVFGRAAADMSMDAHSPPAPQQRQIGATLLEELEEMVNPDDIVTDAPAEQFRLGYLDVVCLILNRVIGEWSAFGSGTPGVLSGMQSLTVRP